VVEGLASQESVFLAAAVVDMVVEWPSVLAYGFLALRESNG